MYIVDLSNPLVVLASLLLSILLIILGKEFKKSALPAISLFLFLILLVIHSMQVLSVGVNSATTVNILSKCLTADTLLLFLSYISYLWVDDIETKAKNKKSIDNSLEWFWRQV